jgi:hypothetical protein
MNSQFPFGSPFDGPDRMLYASHTHGFTFGGKQGWHLSGPGPDKQYLGEFNDAFLNDPPDGWAVDWDNVDSATELCPDDCTEKVRPCKTHKFMGGILVKHIETGRVWRLTGEKSEGGNWKAKWPD